MTQTLPPALLAGKRVHMVSLGCPKNRVDSEIMLGQAEAAGYALTGEAADADLLIVNTCAFIEDSKKESVGAILDLAEIKAMRPGTRLVVAGCLAQRHAEELAAELPEVDVFLGTGEYDHLAQRLGLDSGVAAAQTVKKPRPEYIADHLEPRWIAPESFSTYLKIAEGCDQACTFCIIPKLRGVQRSRSVADCVAEAQQLVARGVVELNVVAQDLTHYGEDIGDPDALAALIRGLGKVDGLRWVRLLYAYPHNVTDNLLDAIAETDNCVKYMDMPLQHASDAVLRQMKRKTNRAEIEALLHRMRTRIPGLTLRTTFLVGHPGETDADFAQLLDFVKAQQFSRAGCFAYSKEEGTLSARMPGQITTAVKKSRLSKLLKLQGQISRQLLAAQVGTEIDVLIEGLSEETDLLLQGRSSQQAPEIDGVVYINDAPADVGRGQIRRVLVTQAGEHDLVGHVI